MIWILLLVCIILVGWALASITPHDDTPWPHETMSDDEHVEHRWK